jgi:hypothetical protein
MIGTLTALGSGRLTNGCPVPGHIGRGFGRKGTLPPGDRDRGGQNVVPPISGDCCPGPRGQPGKILFTYYFSRGEMGPTMLPCRSHN